VAAIRQGMAAGSGHGDARLGPGSGRERFPLGGALHPGGRARPYGVVVLDPLGAESSEKRRIVSWLRMVRCYAVSCLIAAGSLGFMLGLYVGR